MCMAPSMRQANAMVAKQAEDVRKLRANLTEAIAARAAAEVKLAADLAAEAMARQQADADLAAAAADSKTALELASLTRSSTTRSRPATPATLR